MHPTLIAMVAVEREVDIARAAKRSSHVDPARPHHLLDTTPLTHAVRGVGPTRAIAVTKTALAQLASRRFAPQRGGSAGREVCCV